MQSTKAHQQQDASSIIKLTIQNVLQRQELKAMQQMKIINEAQKGTKATEGKQAEIGDNRIGTTGGQMQKVQFITSKATI